MPFICGIYVSLGEVINWVLWFYLLFSWLCPNFFFNWYWSLFLKWRFSGRFLWLLWWYVEFLGHGKIPRYSHRVMHWKRVTCELHDSYFRLMTIKHAIPETAEVTHSNGQLWGDIEWAIELLYNSVKTGSQLVFWRPDPLVTRCSRGSQHPAEWAPRHPVEHQENGKETLMVIRVGVNMFCSVSNSLSHTTLSNKVRGIFF